MKFNRISVIDRVLITEEGKVRLQDYSKMRIDFPSDDPTDQNEVISRIGDSEVALVSLRTPLSSGVFNVVPNLEYILVCSTSTSQVDITAASSHGILVQNVSNYCNEATAEFVISNILNIFRERNQEVYGKRLGIIGCGGVGRIVMDYGLALGMTVVYTSRSRNTDVEKKGAKYLSLIELLQTSDVISLHTPRDLKILNENEFQSIGGGKVLINTAVGEVMDKSGFEKWIQGKGNRAVFDAVTSKSYKDILAEGIIVHNKVAGYTEEAKERMTQKIFENLDHYLNQTSV